MIGVQGKKSRTKLIKSNGVNIIKSEICSTMYDKLNTDVSSDVNVNVNVNVSSCSCSCGSCTSCIKGKRSKKVDKSSSSSSSSSTSKALSKLKIDDWNTGVCMSFTSSKLTDTSDTGDKKSKSKLNSTVQKRCIKNSKNCSDFCGYHNKSKKYYHPLLRQLCTTDMLNLREFGEDIKLIKNNVKKELQIYFTQLKIKSLVQTAISMIDEHTKMLDKDHHHKLMLLEDSWASVPVYRRINLSDGWWDINFLINHFTQQLNNSDMENPYPVFPSSVFSRVAYLDTDILKLRAMILMSAIPINIALYYLIMLEDWVLYTVYNEAIENEFGVSSFLLNYLDSKLRYRRINCKNSQEHFTGYWVMKNSPLSKFEKLYKKYISIAWHVYNYRIQEYEINKVKKDFLQQLDSFPEESWDITNDKLKIKMF